MIDALQNVDETVPLDIPEGHLVQDPDVLSSSSVLPNEVPAHSQQEIHPASGPTRRILPQRTRKVGFGTHDADSLILEAIKNDEKLKGAIPPETVIHCTTNSAALPNARAIIDQIKFECDLDVHGDATQGTEGANLSLHSYFRNAEVMHSLRRQTQIETGKFELVTTEMIEDALQDVPESLLQKPADLTDEMFRRRHLRAQKVETRSRIREKELLNHEVSRLQDRIPQLEVMDPTGFRGETAEEQEHDKQKILRYARQLISKSTHNKEPSVSEPDLDGAEPHPRPPNRPEKKPKANGTARKSKPKLTTTAEELMEIGAPIHKPKKEPKSSRFVYVDDYDMEDPLSPGLPYGRDEEYVEKVSKKKKKGKKGTDLGKRKRDIEFEMDITSVPEIVTAPKKKPNPPESVGGGQGANMSGEAMQEDILKPELEPEPEQEQDILPDEFEPGPEMAALFRTMQRWAHESPVYFYSIVIGATGPVMLAVVPPIRRKLGYIPPEMIPSSYPVPGRGRRPVSNEFDDPPPSEKVKRLLEYKEKMEREAIGDDRFAQLSAQLPQRVRDNLLS
ncbi:hypothetical protein FRC19_004421 [Serendipita sp. 401]|nr:hypothetical protein FRC19_004421 [Serendipita sp. 401]